MADLAKGAAPLQDGHGRTDVIAHSNKGIGTPRPKRDEKQSGVPRRIIQCVQFLRCRVCDPLVNRPDIRDNGDVHGSRARADCEWVCGSRRNRR